MDKGLNKDDFVYYNTTKSRTTQEVYNKTRSNQVLEILKVALAFLIARLLFDLLDSIIISNFKENKYLYIFVITLLIISIMYISIDIFTFLKIENERDEILYNLTN